MKLSFSTRIIAVVLAISSMLCMQFALAAYVCPGMASNSAIMMATNGSADMPGCDGMDMAQAALCHAIRKIKVANKRSIKLIYLQ